MAFRIETLKVYVIGITFPTCLNEPSPAKLIPPLVGDWRTENAGPPQRRSMHRRLGVVLHHDPVTGIAVLLLGSSCPIQPQRYIPWLGTCRLPFQTQQVLQPDGEDGADFRNFPGYLNFSHAIRVLVVQPGAVNRVTNPGPATITHILNRNVNPSDVINIRLSPCELEKLKKLHSSYWDGVRFSADGFEQTGDDEDGQDHGSVQGQGHGSSEGLQSSQGTETGTGTGTGIGGGTGTGTGSLQDGIRAVEASVRAAEASVRLGQALAWEHFRNQQLSMVEGDGDEDEDALDVGSLPRCVLGLLTKKDLQNEFTTEESSIGFPWEMKIGVELES